MKVLLLLLAISSTAAAQYIETKLASCPTGIIPGPCPTVITAQLPDAPAPKFLTKETMIGISAMTALYGIDAYTTTRFHESSRWREQNPIARPFIKSHTSTGIYFGASLGLAIGGTWLCHHEAIRHPHHQKAWHIAERIILWGNVAEESYIAVDALHNLPRL